MAGTGLVRVLLVASVAALVAGCQGEGSPFGKATGPTTNAPAEGSADATAAQTATIAPPTKTSAKSVKLVDRDVEAPEVFSITDMALWDGRPSLGGVWVASPDAVDPERVILRNTANGKFVIGALFRRERDNPGPALQISSDAANALGLLAGEPGKISVTALRREEAPVTAPDASKPILDAAETVETETLAPVESAAATEAPVATKQKSKGFGLFKKKQKASDGPVAPVVSSEPIDTAAVPSPEKTTVKAAAPVAKAGLIQIGIFSVEANATRAVDTLAKAGVTASVRAEKSQGKAFWSVTASGGSDAMAKVKAAGFADAYMLKRG